MDAPVAKKILGALGGPRGKDGGKLSVTTSSGQTAQIHVPDVTEPKQQLVYVDLTTDAACFIEIGTNPTAVVNTSYYLVAGVPYRLPLLAGDKVAAITASGSANLYWHEV